MAPYEGETKLVGAVVDPDHRVLLDEDLSNNAVSSTGSSFAWRVLEEASSARASSREGCFLEP